MDSLQFICDMYEKNQEYEYVSILASQCRNYQPSLQMRSPWCRTVTRPEVTRLQGPSWFGLDGCYPSSILTPKAHYKLWKYITPVVHELPNRQKFSRHKMSLGKHTIDNCLDTRRSNWSLGLPQESRIVHVFVIANQSSNICNSSTLNEAKQVEQERISHNSCGSV